MNSGIATALSCAVALASVAVTPSASQKTGASKHSTAAVSAPAMPFVDWDACPFEGCQYDVEWTALKEITAFENPPYPWSPWKGKPGVPAFPIGVGEKVLAMTGVVFFLSPGRARVEKSMQVGTLDTNFPDLHRTIKLVPGDIVYLLTYQGEGQITAWFRNQLIALDLIGFDGFGSCRGCIRQGKLLEEGRSEWWVKVRNAKGEIGWTDRTKDFDGKDRYGDQW